MISFGITLPSVFALTGRLTYHVLLVLMLVPGAFAFLGFLTHAHMTSTGF